MLAKRILGLLLLSTLAACSGQDGGSSESSSSSSSENLSPSSSSLPYSSSEAIASSSLDDTSSSTSSFNGASSAIHESSDSSSEVSSTINSASSSSNNSSNSSSNNSSSSNSSPTVPTAPDASISINPAIKKQSVTFAGDFKLTLKSVDDGETALIFDRFLDLGFDMVRIPIFGTRPIDDAFNQRVWRTAIQAQAKGLTIFASIANGDGDQNNNLHGTEKFASFLKCNCPFNVYALNYDAYSEFLDSYLTELNANGVSVELLGPFNEDPAAQSDYQKLWDKMTINDFTRVGIETWALAKASQIYPDVGGQVDIVGSHFYDDDQFTPDMHASQWQRLVELSDKPVWFTESTRFIGNTEMQKTVSALNHIIPAMQGGVERVIVYQAANRLVWYNGTQRKNRFLPFKKFIRNALEKRVVESSTDDAEIQAISLISDDNNLLSINITNQSDTDKSVRIQLEGQARGNGITTRTIFTEELQDIANTYPMNSNVWRVSIPAHSFVHLDVPVAVSASE